MAGGNDKQKQDSLTQRAIQWVERMAQRATPSGRAAKSASSRVANALAGRSPNRKSSTRKAAR